MEEEEGSNNRRQRGNERMVEAWVEDKEGGRGMMWGSVHAVRYLSPKRSNTPARALCALI